MPAIIISLKTKPRVYFLKTKFKQIDKENSNNSHIQKKKP